MASKKGRTAGKRRVITVDMEGVESGSRTIPDGVYPAEITSAEEKESSEGNPMLLVKWKTKGKKHSGVTLFDNISLLPQALWRLKGVLEAIGEEVPDSSMEVVLDDLVGREANITITNEDYDGKKRPKVTDYSSLEDKSDDDDDDKDEDEEDEEEESEDEDEDSKDEDEDEDEDEEEEEDEDEEEEEDSRPGRKPTKKGKSTKKTAPKFKVGAKVKFKTEEGKIMRGKVVEIDDDVAKVEDKSGDEWEIDPEELEAA